MIERPSPNFNVRPAGRPIDMLLLHYTGMQSAEAAIDRLCDPRARVGAHYLIDEDGTVYRMVAEESRAWHAGVASWAGESDINGCSIGIELVNPGHEFGYRPFPDAQMTALEILSRDILARHPIPKARVLGHGDVSPARKQDPGELFDWARLAAKNIGLWPRSVSAAEGETLAFGDAGAEVLGLQQGLAQFGYGLAVNGRFDGGTEAVVTAFQRHFRQQQVDGRADGETRAVLRALKVL
ncbi:MAG: N-acetylmuramoyl-L-alanine amidase [Sphingomonadales bacterium]